MWGLLEGWPWIPPLHARALRSSTNSVGTSCAQAHLLVMSLTRKISMVIFIEALLVMSLTRKNSMVIFIG